MGHELESGGLDGSWPEQESDWRGGGLDSRQSRHSYTETFEQCCPYFLAMGMTYEQFWYGDPEMAVAYRKAYKIKKDKENETAWLHGLYVYEALCDVAPVLRAFSKAKKPEAYPSKPHDFGDESTSTASKEDSKEVVEMRKAKTSMEVFAIGFNKQFENKEKDDTRENDTNGSEVIPIG